MNSVDIYITNDLYIYPHKLYIYIYFLSILVVKNWYYIVIRVEVLCVTYAFLLFMFQTELTLLFVFPELKFNR